MTFTRAVATNNYGPAKFIVDGTTTANGTHSTIAAALTSASSGDTIFIRPGTYTENLTLKAGVNLTAFGSDSSANATGKVIISGTCTLTTAGSVTISGIQLQTNSAALLAVTGSAASIVNLQNCYLNCTNNTGITFSSSSSSAQINLEYCRGNLGTTGIGYFSDSSAGTLNIDYCDLDNTGASVTASTKSAGILTARFSTLRYVLTYSSSNTTSAYLFCNTATNAINTTAITTSGTGTFTVDGGRVDSGTASSISVGAGTTVACRNCVVFSTNTNAITGAGTITYTLPNFSSTSRTINTTTQVDGNSGTFTPGLSFGGGTTGITYSSQTGKYVRIGSLIYFDATVTLSNKGSSTGAAKVTGLPFTAAASFSPACTIRSSLINTGADSFLASGVDPSATTVSLYYIATAGGGAIAVVPETSFSNNTSFSVTGFYTTS